jgi:hypothetical protein
MEIESEVVALFSCRLDELPYFGQEVNHLTFFSELAIKLSL